RRQRAAPARHALQRALARGAAPGPGVAGRARRPGRRGRGAGSAGAGDERAVAVRRDRPGRYVRRRARGNERVIDAHQHFWRFDPDQYPWMAPDQGVLRRDHLPAELEGLMPGAGVVATVAVQARRTLQETEWLLD